MDYLIRTEQFEGPIHLLLELIEKRKMPINDISLAAIADEYIAFLRNQDESLLPQSTYFVFVASALVLIKSKSLLPTLELSEEEEGDIETLKKQIALFQEYQKAADSLKKNLKKTPAFFYAKTPKRQIQFLPSKEINKENLLNLIKDVFHEVPEKPQTKKEGHVRIIIHIEEMMRSLHERIQSIQKINFDTFIRGSYPKDSEPAQERVYQVVGFLAVLELVKKQMLHADQKTNFSSIEIEKI